MTPPVATYRLQFREGMTLCRAAALAPYLAGLGISDLYASPLFAAAAGSTHGYDGVDFARIEPAIGGEEGFLRLSAALMESGLGLLLDFVPNHMAADAANPWWRSVLEWGRASPFAAHFDIDWSAPKLLLPILGAAYGDTLRDGSLGLAFDAGRATFEMTCYDRHLPLTPPSYAMLLARARNDAVAALAPRFAEASAAAADALKTALAALAAETRPGKAIADMVAIGAADKDFLHEIHEAQHWRLAHWRLAREALTYRRFFEISGLAGVRVEDPAVFTDVHARLLALIAAGRVTGVRIDHIDGLADPKAYLRRMRDAAPYLLVEKIVERNEGLRTDWPVDGTTGYEFIAALAGLFVDGAREEAMTRAYCAFTGDAADYAAAAAEAKREIFERNLAAELAYLTGAAAAFAAADTRTRDIGRDSLRRAIVELAVALPVYRSYVDRTGPSPTDRRLITEAVKAAAATRRIDDGAALDFIAKLLLADVGRPIVRDAVRVFAARFQQTTGPVMAKGIEDTLFYRHGRLLALNEVGGAPERYGAPLQDFHAAMSARLSAQPGGLSATSTHDTKRGEDARARLYALSEIPDAWRDGVARWSSLNAAFRTELPDGPAPDPVLEWMFYQALAGAWPAEWIDAEAPPDAGALDALCARMRAYMEKAVREAKLRTSWTNPNDGYEKAVAAFVAAALSDAGRAFRDDFVQVCRPAWIAGALNSLAQLAVKLAAPGVPDFYQGTELWDFSLVDPDNRRTVDFAARAALAGSVRERDAEALIADWRSGAPKLALMLAGLRLRNADPELFAAGDYVPLTADGSRGAHVAAFARTRSRAFAVAVVPRFAVGLTADAKRPHVPKEAWGDTVLPFPEGLRGRPLRDAVTGETHGGDGIILREALGRFPVALLYGEA